MNYRRRAEALRADPQLTADAAVEERRAEELLLSAQLLDQEAAAGFAVPTAADFERRVSETFPGAQPAPDAAEGTYVPF